MTESNNTLTTQPSGEPALTKFEADLVSSSPPKQMRLIREIEALGASGYPILQTFLLTQQQQNAFPTYVEGRCYEVLWNADDSSAQHFLQTHFPEGIVPLKSDRNIDYAPLLQLLLKRELQAADRLTLEKLCELAGDIATQRRWVYFTEVEQMPEADLQTLNRLWWVHSEGKFGFTVQRQIWLNSGRSWENLWAKIAWKNGRTWSRYPEGFIWDLAAAPPGHLPLSNQLRGVQAYNALLSHPAWSK